MSRAPRTRRRKGVAATTPVIECQVVGPRGELGCLLRAPRKETLLWDLENEVVSARREWLDEHGGWWVAASYADTLIDAVLRSFSEVLILDPSTGDRLVSLTDGGQRIERAF